LRPDNFTPPSRTPWGGTRLMRHYKAALGLQSIDPSEPVGEAWELSTSDEFHSLTETGELLGDMLARDPRAWLGDEALLGQRSTSLLVKWIDAGDDLSLQIHPEDDYAGLGPDEGGKLEAWYIVAHEPGAGLYLGFQPEVRPEEIRELLASDADLSARMSFMPVQRGDFVVLEPGTPHAIGRGVTLLEPQVVRPPRRGVTYRYWDWRRRYDARGRPDPQGAPRALHTRDALAVTRWERAVDPLWLASRVRRAGWPALHEPARCELLCAPGPGNALHCTRLRVARVCGTGTLLAPAWNALRALTVVEGRVVLGSGAEAQELAAGSSAALPAAAGAIEIELHAAHALLASAAG
jgi:mannose-6-phosphate isomerase